MPNLGDAPRLGGGHKPAHGDEPGLPESWQTWTETVTGAIFQTLVERRSMGFPDIDAVLLPRVIHELTDYLLNEATASKYSAQKGRATFGYMADVSTRVIVVLGGGTRDFYPRIDGRVAGVTAMLDILGNTTERGNQVRDVVGERNLFYYLGEMLQKTPLDQGSFLVRTVIGGVGERGLPEDATVLARYYTAIGLMERWSRAWVGDMQLAQEAEAFSNRIHEKMLVGRA